MGWCESHQVHYVFGLARNSRLRRKIARPLREAKQEQQRIGKAARRFTEFSYRTRKSWSRTRRVVAKAEYLEKSEKPRFVVISLDASAWPAQELFEQPYCAGGEMENRIKEQLSLFSDRLSTETMGASQLRLYFSSLAYVLMRALRRLALAGTEWATAQVQTLRWRMLKIAAEVRLTARRIWVRYSRAWPWKIARQNTRAAAHDRHSQQFDNLIWSRPLTAANCVTAYSPNSSARKRAIDRPCGQSGRSAQRLAAVDALCELFAAVSEAYGAPNRAQSEDVSAGTRAN